MPLKFNVWVNTRGTDMNESEVAMTLRGVAALIDDGQTKGVLAFADENGSQRVGDWSLEVMD